MSILLQSLLRILLNKHQKHFKKKMIIILNIVQPKNLRNQFLGIWKANQTVIYWQK